MRVIAGTAKGRRLKAPPADSTRPFTGRAKEGVFSSIGDRLAGARVLDLYAGSGSLAIEALSRGAAAATLIERDRRAVGVIRHNLETCAFEADVIHGELPAALARVSGTHDLVFVDPPYRLSLASVGEVLQMLPPLLADGATVVWHHRKGADGRPVLESLIDGLEVEDERAYGDSHIVRLRKRGNA